jgi:hypothetical protein
VGSTIKGRGHDDIATNVSSAPTVECTNDAVNKGVDNTSLLGTHKYLTAGNFSYKFTDVSNRVLFHNLGCKKTPVASLKSQGCQEKRQHVPSNGKVVLDQDMPTSVYLDVYSLEKEGFTFKIPSKSVNEPIIVWTPFL